MPATPLGGLVMLGSGGCRTYWLAVSEGICTVSGLSERRSGCGDADLAMTVGEPELSRLSESTRKHIRGVIGEHLQHYCGTSVYGHITSNRVHTLFGTSNSMTFHDYHDQKKSNSMTFRGILGNEHIRSKKKMFKEQHNASFKPQIENKTLLYFIYYGIRHILVTTHNMNIGRA